MGDLLRRHHHDRGRRGDGKSPFDSIATLTVVVGIWLIVIGVFEVVSAFGIRKASKNVAAVREKLTTPPTTEAAG